MEILVALAVLAGLLLPAGVLRALPSALGREGGGGGPLEPADDLAEEPGASEERCVDDGLLSLSFVQRRLDALADELARLDDDPGVLARAFRTTVALTAYEALLADASRLAREPALHVDATLGFELIEPS